MDDALAVISASTDNIEIMQNVLERRAQELGATADELRPEQWLETFYAMRKGSGKSADSQRQRPAVASG
jgi:type IV secretion system protein VirB4